MRAGTMPRIAVPLPIASQGHESDELFGEVREFAIQSRRGFDLDVAGDEILATPRIHRYELDHSIGPNCQTSNHGSAI